MQSQPWKVLYVDDNENDSLLVRSLLLESRREQFELQWEATVEAALPKIELGDMDAILVDHHLGSQNGLDLARYAIEQGCKAPIILITGYDSYELDLEAMQAGVSDYLVKSELTATLLERSLRYTIERKRAEEALRQMAADLEAQIGERTYDLALVVEDLQAEIAERKKGEEALKLRNQSIQLLQSIAIAANEASTVEDALQFSLEKVGQFGNWSLGNVYWCVPAIPDQLVPTGWWYPQSSDNFTSFQKLTEQTLMKAGTGMPGRVMEERRPMWVNNIQEVFFPARADEAKKAGFRTAFAFPVMVGSEVAAVLEFFSESVMEPEAEFSDLMAQIGTQLGRVVERVRAEERFQRHAARIEALAELSQMLAESETDVRKVLDTISVRVTKLIGDTCTIALLSQDRQHLEVAAFYHHDPRAIDILEEIKKLPQPASRDPYRQALQTGQPVLLSNLSQEQLRSTIQSSYIPYLDQFGIYDVFIVPLRVQGQSIGTLAVSRDQPGRSYTFEEQKFLQELADHAALAIFNAQLFQKLQSELAERKRIEAELAELQRRLMDSVDIEGLHLAKRLHDDAIQGLYGVIFALEAMRDDLRGEENDLQLDTVKAELQQVINIIQLIYQELRPPTLVPFGVDKAIESYTDHFRQKHPEMGLNLDLEPDVRSLPEQSGYILFRIYQHAMDNIARHAQATHIDVRLWQEEKQVVLEIEDNGRGFQVPLKWIDLAREGRYGLARAAERAEAVGGELKVESNPGRGTRIRASLPRAQTALLQARPAINPDSASDQAQQADGSRQEHPEDRPAARHG